MTIGQKNWIFKRLSINCVIDQNVQKLLIFAVFGLMTS